MPKHGVLQSETKAKTEKQILGNIERKIGRNKFRNEILIEGFWSSKFVHGFRRKIITIVWPGMKSG
jgi:hypothetical protein